METPNDAAPGATTAPTVLDRILGAGLSEARARKWIAEKAVHVEGEVASNPDHPAVPPARWMISPG